MRKSLYILKSYISRDFSVFKVIIVILYANLDNFYTPPIRVITFFRG